MGSQTRSCNITVTAAPYIYARVLPATELEICGGGKVRDGGCERKADRKMRYLNSQPQ